MRGTTDRTAVNGYARAMKAGEQFPPLLAGDLDGALVLIDGFHRLAAMRLLGVEEGAVEIVACATLEDVRWRAYQANLRHGRPLRAKHMRSALAALISAGEHKVGRRFKSYRELARELPSVSYSAIRRWMEADFPDVFEALGREGGAAPGGLPAGPTIEKVLFDAIIDGISEVAAQATGLKRVSRKVSVAKRLREVAAALDPEGALGNREIDLSSYS